MCFMFDPSYTYRTSKVIENNSIVVNCRLLFVGSKSNPFPVVTGIESGLKQNPSLPIFFFFD